MGIVSRNEQKSIMLRCEDRRRQIGMPYEAGCISREDLSIRAGLAKSAYTSLIYGYRELKECEIPLLAKALYVSPQYLRTGQGAIYECPPIRTASQNLILNLLPCFKEGLSITDILEIIKSYS